MATNVSKGTLDKLRAALGPSGISEDPAELTPHLSEWRNRWHGETPLLLKPATTREVSSILQICSNAKTPIVPQGGNTGLVGGQIPTQGELLLSLERMNKIRGVWPEDNLISVEAGAVLRDVQQAAEQAGRLFPLSLGAEGTCTIGGNLSTNAGGTNVLRYGTARDLVLGLEVVLADGRVLDMMRGLRKDNTGYDLKQLFIGAEGTLGVITAAMLKLYPNTSKYTTVFASLSGIEAAVELLNRIQLSVGNSVTGFELLPRLGLELVRKHVPQTSNPLKEDREWYVLVEVSNYAAFDPTEALEEGLAQSIEDGLVADAVFAKSERERGALWLLREAIPEAQRIDGASISSDISVLPSQIPALIHNGYGAILRAFSSALPFAFGHVGDGNIHLAVRAGEGQDEALLAARETIEQAVNEVVGSLGGSISAEHGLGLAKNEIITRYKSAAEVALMKSLKTALDPQNILNPGKVLPSD